MTITAFSPLRRPDLLHEFTELRDRIYSDKPDFYPESAVEEQLIAAYAARPDYRLTCLLSDDPAARILVGTADGYPFAFFGFFEAPDDPAFFAKLEGQALDEVRAFGKREIRGPLNLNALHGWMFLDRNESGVRWLGDPYHDRHHLRLFVEAGFRETERGQSGIADPEVHLAAVAKAEEWLAALPREGLTLRFTSDLELPAELPAFHRLTEICFSVEANGYVPVPYPIFEQSVMALLKVVKHPRSIISIFRGQEPVAYALSYPNELYRLTGRARPTDGSAHLYSAKTVCIAPEFRGGKGLFKVLAGLVAREADKLGHPYGFRRINVKNRSGSLLRGRSTVTQEYVLLAKDL